MLASPGARVEPTQCKLAQDQVGWHAVLGGRLRPTDARLADSSDSGYSETDTDTGIASYPARGTSSRLAAAVGTYPPTGSTYY